jgi:hypothetical protein
VGGSTPATAPVDRSISETSVESDVGFCVPARFFDSKSAEMGDVGLFSSVPYTSPCGIVGVASAPKTAVGTAGESGKTFELEVGNDVSVGAHEVVGDHDVVGNCDPVNCCASSP